MSRRAGALAASLAALSLAACVSTGKPKPVVTAAPAPAKPSAPAATPNLAPRERVDLAMRLLGGGLKEQARLELTAALADKPGDPAARRLLNQIDRDPRELLGARNFPYKAQAGDSFSELAERFLGDSLMFYALARYNGIDAPSRLEAGRDLLIPGVPRKAPAAKTAPAPTSPAAPAGGPAAQATRDPVRANRLRGTALNELNRGSIDSAVLLLRQANRLDPENGLIRRDLDRAVRIQSTVRGRS